MHPNLHLTSTTYLLPLQVQSCGMLHSAAHHPGTHSDAPPRHSYEMRLLAVI